ncbi:MAG TPA: SPOR domain-containing protein [Phenylobacterium sp.]|nr:SPOR domain-containing protein [Phenylobacterium sp.]
MAGSAAVALLSACATSGPDAAGGPAALFRARIGDTSEAVAPGLRSAWYVQRQPIQYAKVGVASWRPAASNHSFSAWVARLFHRRGAAAVPPTAVVAMNVALPVPSLVQVTNLRTFQTITVRVDDKARLGDQIIRLPPEVAQGLGAEPGKPLMVRMRYSAPVLAYRQPPTLRYALLGRAPRNPAAPLAAPTAFAAQARRAAPAAAPAPASIVVAQLAPPPAPAPRPALALRPSLGGAPQPLRGEMSAAPHGFRVQAGAFAQYANAARAVSLLAHAGDAVIVPVKRGELTLYRVVLSGPRDAAGAERLRSRVAEAGFADARLIRPL